MSTYDVSGATDAVYTNADHSEFTVKLNGVVIEAKALPGLMLFDALMENAIPIAEYVPAPPPVPESITDWQFFQQLAVIGIITQDEALASNGGVIPAPMLDIIDQLPSEKKFEAKMRVGGSTVYHRDNWLTIAIGAAYGWTTAQIDDFFRAAAAL